MNDVVVLGSGARRRWLAHCSVVALAGWAGLAAPASAQGPAAAGGGKKVPLILVVGDSLSAEYGLVRGKGWVALLQARLAQRKIAASVVNASISGDTTAGGRTRLPMLLAKHQPDIVVLELGANDALRGLPLSTTRDNVRAMTHAAKTAGAAVVITGMQLPPNYGKLYGAQFAALFAEVAKAENAALVPFLLRGVADGPDADKLFQPDRIHPTAAAHPTILDNVWEALQPVLAKR